MVPTLYPDLSSQQHGCLRDFLICLWQKTRFNCERWQSRREESGNVEKDGAIRERYSDANLMIKLLL